MRNEKILVDTLKF